jgi:transposase
MDGDGIPLAFNISKGNTNEQVTMKPLESKILKDFKLSKFVVCTDAGLASADNRKFNDMGDRAFITTQSVKKLKKLFKEWALDSFGWQLSGSDKVFNISTDLDKDADLDKIFYKERWINENGLEQKIIVTFSLKYKIYQSKIRESQRLRAENLIATNPKKIGKANQNDYKRLITAMNCTKDGEVAEHAVYSINDELISDEASFDGFYAVCTNLNSEASEIIKVNKKRWEIEECFRIMKSEFKARPVYLSRDDRIEAHFATCFLSLMIYRILEKKLEEKYTCDKITDTLRNMSFLEIDSEGYIPTYTRSDLTDDLHEKFGFRTDYQIVTKRNLKNIFKETKR